MGFLLNTDYLLFMHVYNCSQHMSLSNIYIITDNFILLTCIRFQRVCKSSKYFFKILNGFSEVMVTYWIFFFWDVRFHLIVLCSMTLFVYGSFSPWKNLFLQSCCYVLGLCHDHNSEAFELSDKRVERGWWKL